MLGNLQGYHVLIVLAVVVVIAALIVVVIFSLSRRNTGTGEPVPSDPASRMEQLTLLRDQWLISEEEFEAKRLELLRHL
ncbi:hypothetical protein C5B96_03650 [Subtercola sp. Z020]|uniref:hypothetical protein n=1 Tax=Subtercola sp. Z020 TaxID=2080582 RepID=UPI000CE77082|nr:hypothetical protein [Subtercola sp. Z020]PPF87809.1 hypothetical protein C5B96_03650 [Subtercola sp. Z020]